VIRYPVIWLVKTFAATHSLKRDKLSVVCLLVGIESCPWVEGAAG
jgi:hypothetical protein